MGVADKLRNTGIDAVDLAARSGLPLSDVQEILGGKEPSMRQVRALAAGLNVPISFLGDLENSKATDLRLQFRATVSSDAPIDRSVEKISRFVANALEVLPPRDAQPSILESKGMGGAIVDNARRILGFDDPLAPAYDLPLKVDAQDGIILSRLNNSRFEGVSLFESNYVFIFVSPRFIPRMLFTLAHELGHAVLMHLEQGHYIFDLPSSIGNIRKNKKNEREADLFAGNLLLPELAVARFLREIRRQFNIADREPLGDVEISYLARFFGVSFDVAAFRCEILGLLPEGGAYSLSSYIKKNHGSPEKRADKLGIPGRPKSEFPIISSKLKDSIFELLDKGEISTGWVSENFDLSVPEIFNLH